MDHLKQLYEVRNQLQSELFQLPLYKKLQSIERAIAEFEGPDSRAAGSQSVSPRRASVNSHIIDAVELELQKRNSWMRSTELARILEARGIKLRTSKTAPQSHLAAILSSRVTRGRVVHKYKRGYGLPSWLKAPPASNV